MAKNVAVGLLENSGSPLSYYFRNKDKFRARYLLKRERILSRNVQERRRLGIQPKNKFAFKGKDKNAYLQDYIIFELGNRCFWCGSKKRLELDHIQPKGNKTHQVQLKELDLGKIRVLCHRCHKVRHIPHLMKDVWKPFPNLFYLE